MKIRIKNDLYSPENEPILLMFNNKEDLASHIKNLIDMLKNDKVLYLIYNDKKVTKKEVNRLLKMKTIKNEKK